jgi:hypothetical protein
MTRPTFKRKLKPATGRQAMSAPIGLSPKANGANHLEQPGGRWTFLTNHAHVLLLLARNPSIVLREVATLVKITERAVQRIIADLEEEGFIERQKVGRQNHYRIIRERKLRHAVEGHRTIGDLLRIIDDGK